MLAFLCVYTDAECSPEIVEGLPEVEDIRDLVLDGSYSDVEGSYAILAATYDSQPDVGVCGTRVEELYRRAPQTYAQLSVTDKTCFEGYERPPGELAGRIGQALYDGRFNDARALMFLAEIVHGAVAIDEDIAPAVRDQWSAFLERAEADRGEGSLSRSLPLDLVLVAAQLEESS
ncbi:MAG: hypothetical protein Q4P33_09290 [Flaviflexus sp.]|nr:hypothetical protein [Flaviflexus sp.]